MKRLALFSICILFANSLFSQSTSFGVTVGGGWNELHRPPHFDRESPQGVGYFTGFYIDAHPNDRFVLRTEIQLSQRFAFDNERFQYRTYMYESGIGGAWSTVTEYDIQHDLVIRDTFFQIPVITMVRVVRGLHIIGGFQFSAMLNVKVTGSRTRFYTDGWEQKIPIYSNSSGSLNEFALLAGLNYVFPSGVGIVCKYQKAITNRFDGKYSLSPAFDYRESYRMIQIAVTFRLSPEPRMRYFE